VLGTVADAVADVRERVAGACRRAGRDPSDVCIVAVSKVIEPDPIAEVVAAGITDIGVNRAQELRDKAALVPPEVRWHYLGELQTNKVRYLDAVAFVHGLCRPAEAEALQRRAERTSRSWDAFVEVNIAGEPSKRGVAPEALAELLDAVDACTLVRPRGIMIVAPITQNPEDVRWVFVEARRLRDRLRGQRPGMEGLSMGMSDDFEIAIEEGATVVRIGRAIFPRS